MYDITGDMPATLVPVAAARVYGEQTINRAELMAVTEVVKRVTHAKIYTDSSYACSSVAECFNASTISDLCRCNHLDLHSELLQHLKPSQQVVKIAAHQDLTKLWGWTSTVL